MGGWAAPWAASAINESHFSCRLATEGAEKRAKGKRSREIKVGGRDEEGIRKDQMFRVSTIEYHISCSESNFVFNSAAPARTPCHQHGGKLHCNSAQMPGEA